MWVIKVKIYIRILPEKYDVADVEQCIKINQRVIITTVLSGIFVV